MTYTISAVAKQFGLSRTALLYYDEIGLLSPRGRSSAGYRVYTEKDLLLMKEISCLRNAGLCLRDIQKTLGHKSSHREGVLRKRLEGLNGDIRRLREQQQQILSLLGTPEMSSSTRVLTKEKWVACLRKAGLDDKGMIRWHAEFEKSSPEAHQDFLESLGLAQAEISAIRKHCLDVAH
jgi:DNA-binding transcriptional MerR regulator